MSVKYRQCMCSNWDVFNMWASSKLVLSVQEVQRTAHKYLVTESVAKTKTF